MGQRLPHGRSKERLRRLPFHLDASVSATEQHTPARDDRRWGEPDDRGARIAQDEAGVRLAEASLILVHSGPSHESRVDARI